MIGISPSSRDVFAPLLNKLVYVLDSLMAGHYSVKGTKTVGKQVGKLLATNRTCLYSRQLFCVGKLESDV